MKYLNLLLSLLLLFAGHLSADESYKVAQYSTGERGTKGFELFSFYTNSDSTHAKIEYVYGDEEKVYPLKLVKKTIHGNKIALTVRFPNKYTLQITPQADLSLKIQDKAKKYSKIFHWMYEGPVNGVGTFCSACVEDEKEAIQLLKNL